MIEFQRDTGWRASYRLMCETWVPAGRDEVFSFFSDATTLEMLTPEWLNFSILTPQPIEMSPGRILDYKLRIHGLPMRWQSRISEWDAPTRFADEQLRGPYRRWYHIHSFEPRDGGTLCRDEIRYATYGGDIIHWLFVKRDLRKIFTYRGERLLEFFGPRPNDSTSRAVLHP